MVVSGLLKSETSVYYCANEPIRIDVRIDNTRQPSRGGEGSYVRASTTRAFVCPAPSVFPVDRGEFFFSFFAFVPTKTTLRRDVSRLESNGYWAFARFSRTISKIPESILRIPFITFSKSEFKIVFYTFPYTAWL